MTGAELGQMERKCSALEMLERNHTGGQGNFRRCITVGGTKFAFDNRTRCEVICDQDGLAPTS